MEIVDFLTQDAVLPRLKAASKKQALQELSATAAKLCGLHERQILGVLMEREKLGSTGLGQGIAIPHGKLAGIKHVLGVFARLEAPVEFEAVDSLPVDLMFLLLVPEGAGADHLKALARVSRLLRDKKMVEKLRATDTAEALYALLADGSAKRAA
ncbi:MAG: PTS IIA-like nitrogen regulatory protein PtsN [Alphaproteobacteria bacterium]|nr:PTS IIA-like nitrogen regulatory protein PtsN [Alphaproteobacteria bacterium]